ncbi:putative quinol monooxygenase [Sphingopyxis sp. JAI108]|uniref:putative quinol monooxygenase n=1 Tax=Sphingopyxis sp. JAI108 TaxID=2723060 RepID=UPI0017FFD9C6|nr:antibiotic biosynthesis monooxygenase [Sphingopyxis sp. JAI108]NYF31936.1 quinol monooxygenase YgiN [Sphingopyxis sp. JAI108]
MILITGHVILTPEHRERRIALGAEHSARSRGEAGCLTHRCHVDVEQPDRLVFVEEWADIAAVRTHVIPDLIRDRGARIRRLRRRNTRPLAAAAGDPDLCRRGYHREADGVIYPSRLRDGLFRTPDLIRGPSTSRQWMPDRDRHDHRSGFRKKTLSYIIAPCQRRRRSFA